MEAVEYGTCVCCACFLLCIHRLGFGWKEGRAGREGGREGGRDVVRGGREGKGRKGQTKKEVMISVR